MYQLTVATLSSTAATATASWAHKFIQQTERVLIIISIALLAFEVLRRSGDAADSESVSQDVFYTRRSLISGDLALVDWMALGCSSSVFDVAITMWQETVVRPKQMYLHTFISAICICISI